MAGLARFTDRDDEPAGRVWAAELVALAESTPLLLLDDPAWHVDRVDDRGDDICSTNGNAATGRLCGITSCRPVRR